MSGGFSPGWRLIARRAWQRPGESLLAISALALGIGVSTAMACILQGVLARPLPASAAERLVSITAEGGADEVPPGISPQELAAWRREARGLGALCGWSWVSEALSGDGMSAEDEKGALVSSDFFRIIGTPNEPRLAEPDDPLRQEIELAIDLHRVIIPILIDDFDFKSVSAHLTDKLRHLPDINGVRLWSDCFDEGMLRLRDRFLKSTPPRIFA